MEEDTNSTTTPNPLRGYVYLTAESAKDAKDYTPNPLKGAGGVWGWLGGWRCGYRVTFTDSSPTFMM